MASVSPHIVRRLTLEFGGIEDADSRQFQGEISELLQRKILSLLDKYLSKHSPDESIHRIESLTLDLGTISRNDLEKDLIEKLSRQLEIYFQPQLFSGADFIAEKENAEKVREKIEKVSEQRNHLELFRFFVETGNLPWWTDSKIADPVGESLDYLIRNDEFALRHLLYKWANRPEFFKRIVLQSGFPKWAEIAAINLDCTGAELISVLSPLIDSFAETTSQKSRPKHKVYEIFGLKLLSLIFLSPHKIEVTNDFWQGFLTQLAAERSIKQNDLFAELIAQFKENKQSKPDWQKDHPDSFLWKNKTPNGTLQENLSKRVKHLLKNKTPNGTLQENLFERVKHLLKNKTFNAEKKAKWLERLQKLNEQVMKPADLQEIAQLLEAETVVPDETEIKPEKDSENKPNLTEKPKQNEPFGAAEDAAEDEKAYLSGITSDEIYSKQKAKPTEDEKARFSDVAESNSEKRLARIEKSRFSDTDELYIGNAGLVILYPFLTRFFENLDLVEDRRFVNEVAAHRAAGLLQFLVDGQEIPLEYHCGLNKILCGLDTEIVLEFGEPVTPEEAQICETFLEAVIANAPILGEMTIQGFRGSFLMRKGILRAGLGAWQLNVERETYDIVLERFPWNWSIVKLPWIEWAIGVEWL